MDFLQTLRVLARHPNDTVQLVDTGEDEHKSRGKLRVNMASSCPERILFIFSFLLEKGLEYPPTTTIHTVPYSYCKRQ